MSVDVVVSVPAFLDMTFVGLEGLPGLGEERFAGDLVRSPGGGAITAIGTARLGLETVLCSPLGNDPAGEMVEAMIGEEGVRVVGPRCPRTPITAVMPIRGDRAMVTYDPGVRARAADVAALAPRAVITGLSQPHVARPHRPPDAAPRAPRASHTGWSQLAVFPGGPRAYVTVGDDDARAFAG